MKAVRKTTEDYFDSPMQEYPWYLKLFYGICVVLVGLFTKLYWRWGASGPCPFKRRKKGERGRVIVANHASMLDPVVLILAAATHGTRLRPLYKSEFDKNSFVSGFFARIGAIPIKRGSADIKAVKRAVRAIGNGEDICIFPEGTRTRDPHARPKLYGGFSLIAQMAKCEVVPIAIDGSERICPSGKGFPRPAHVRIRYGEPIAYDEVEGSNRREQAEALERISMERVYAMRDELRQEHGKDKA